MDNRETSPLKLENLEIYNAAMEIGEKVWQIVVGWEHQNRVHPGNQFTRAADSITANIAEGHGRYFSRKNGFSFFTEEVPCSKLKHGLPNRITESW